MQTVCTSESWVKNLFSVTSHSKSTPVEFTMMSELDFREILSVHSTGISNALEIISTAAQAKCEYTSFFKLALLSIIYPLDIFIWTL